MGLKFSRSVAAMLAVNAFSLGAPSVVLAASTVIYTYDTRGQLIALSSSVGTSASYTYDAVGNRIQMTATGSVSLRAPDDNLLLSGHAEAPIQTEKSSAAIGQPSQAETASRQAAVANNTGEAQAAIGTNQ